jgi:hypothetical protein
LGGIAEFESDLIRARTSEGRAPSGAAAGRRPRVNFSLASAVMAGLVPAIHAGTSRNAPRGNGMIGSCCHIWTRHRVDGRRDELSLIWIRNIVRRRAALDTSASPIDVAERIVRHIER